VSFATPPNSAQVHFLPIYLLTKGLLLTTLYTNITSMNNHINDEHEDIVIKYKLHCKQGKSIGLACEKNKKQKGVAPCSITNFSGSLTKALIQHKCISLKT
jgi:hypothetical protein